MAEIERNKIAKEFSELTGLLEDAAAISVEGQSTTQSLDAMNGSVRRLQALLTKGAAKLAQIELYIGEHGKK